MTGVLSKREMESQVLDNMDIEKERGITIKSQAVRMKYTAKDGNNYELNLIDTPGHVDFNYEVSRSLAACDGAILVDDASQGVEAQTLANVYLAIDNNLEILPVINKVDLPNARPDEVKKQIEDIIGIPAETAPCISAKTGLNVEEVLERIVTDIPAPTGDENAPLKCLIFDSIYNDYKGAIAYVRVKDGTIKVGQEIMLMASKKKFTVTEVGYFEPGSYEPAKELKAGEVGYIAASIKSLSDIRVGDTITLSNTPAKEPLPGYKKVNPMVYCGIYPVDGSDYENLKIALEKLIDDGRIHPSKIEEMVEKAKEEVENTIKEEGERAVIETGVIGLHPDLVKLIGKLKYRTSYGQNVLNHSIEVSNLARIMAEELGLNPKLARRAGLLHDIGKALDHDMEGTHVEIGVEILKKYKENPIVINAVEAHHEDVEPQSIEAVLIQAADAISASRPGARRETLENYIKRLQNLEGIADSFDGVEKSFAIQAGREIRVLVKPEKISDDQMVVLSRDIAKKIEDEMEYPGQIKVNVIRESRVVDYAK